MSFGPETAIFLDILPWLLWLLSVVWAFLMGYILGRRHRGNGPPPGDRNGEGEQWPATKVAL